MSAEVILATLDDYARSYCAKDIKGLMAVFDTGDDISVIALEPMNYVLEKTRSGNCLSEILVRPRPIVSNGTGLTQQFQGIMQLRRSHSRSILL